MTLVQLVDLKKTKLQKLGLDKERYVPVMLISIGKAADSGYQSVRLPIEKVAEWK